MFGCGDSPRRSQRPREATPPATSRAETPQEASAELPQVNVTSIDLPSVVSAGARIVAIGDLHGDLSAAHRVLKLAGLVNDALAWIGGETQVVQLGDLLDRGDGERQLFELFLRLRDEAKEAGGRFIVLNGNHELMNAAGDLRYVTRGGLLQFRDAPLHPTLEEAVRGAPSNVRGRLRAFLPGGPMAQAMATFPVAVRVGSTVFVHGGLTPQYTDLSALNAQVSQWLLGHGRVPPAVVDDQGPVWNRAYSDRPDEGDCSLLTRTLAALGAERMIVAHTVQRDGARAFCDDRVYAIDVGMSAHYGGPIQALEIRGDAIRVLSEAD